jgi:diguanylate cyclase
MRLFTKRITTSERSVAEIEADLERSQERQALYLLTIRALLYCIKEFSLDLIEIDADRFKEHIDTLTGYVLDEEKPAQFQRTFAGYQDIILAYIGREKDYLRDREGEFRNIIEVLTTGLTTLTEDNQKFNTRMYERSVKLEKITYLDDIRKMKQELQQEVEQIKDQVRDKQTRDAQRLQVLSQEVKTLQFDVEKAQQTSQMASLAPTIVWPSTCICRSSSSVTRLRQLPAPCSCWTSIILNRLMIRMGIKWATG